VGSETMVGGKPRRKKSRRGRAILIVCLVVILGVGGFFGYRALFKTKVAAIQYTTSAAQKVTIIQSVSGTGSVQLSSVASISPEVTGTVSGLEVAVGDTVTEGQPLFTVVNEDLDVAVLQATNSYNQALKSVQDAKLSLLQAQKNLEDLEYKRTQQQWGSSDQVQFVSLKVTPPSTTTSTTARSSTTTVTEPKTTTTTISDLAIMVAEQQVVSAELAVTLADTNVKVAGMSLDKAKLAATKREVVAPLSGTVTEVNISNGDQVGSSSGSGSGSGSSASIVVCDLNVWDVNVTLAEADIGSVKVGQKATLTFDALPDLSLTGKVSIVDASGANSSGVVSYSATVVPDIGSESVRGGMTVTVGIVTQISADVIGVPIAAVKTLSDGSSYVQLLENGKPVNQTVEVGVSDDTYTEITSGLTEGQEVVTRTVNPGASTSTTSRGGNSGGLLNGGGGSPSGGFPAGGPPGN
jgi:RND family efflux transporter MFP subunit